MGETMRREDLSHGEEEGQGSVWRLSSAQATMTRIALMLDTPSLETDIVTSK